MPGYNDAGIGGWESFKMLTIHIRDLELNFISRELNRLYWAAIDSHRESGGMITVRHGHRTGGVLELVGLQTAETIKLMNEREHLVALKATVEKRWPVYVTW